MFLPENASAQRVREATRARDERLQIIRALTQGQVTRRDLIKWGLFTAAGVLADRHGLSPFVSAVRADSNIPTGLPASPLFGVQKFTQAMLRLDLMPRYTNLGVLNPAPMAEANQAQQTLDPALGAPAGATGPIEGRPPGPVWAHQGFAVYPPRIAVIARQRDIAANRPVYPYDPGVAASLNSGTPAGATIPNQFHPGLPVQQANRLWTFNGSLPFKLLQARYGEPILFRHYNDLPPDRSKNAGFGLNTITTHEHNGHHGAENDGFTGAFFFPNQFYDYHWPLVLAGVTTINTAATDPRAGTPDDHGGIYKIPGDWHETMSSHWFHDHMFSFTSQNVYKGNAAMYNIYSSLDRGDETIHDGVNLQLPSGSSNHRGWGNLDYDVNLMIADKAWDAHGQLFMDIFDFDGFLGDRMTVNALYCPYFEVEARKYRFRILNASVARFFKIALSDGSPMIQVANDGNLMPNPVVLTQLDEQGIGERYDIVIDFSRYTPGPNTKVWMVNLTEHEDGKRPAHDLTLAEALQGNSQDPCVGKFLEFRVVRPPPTPDVSQVPDVLIPNPDLSAIPVSRIRTFVFGDGADQSSPRSSPSAFRGPWGIQVDKKEMLAADYGRLSLAPVKGTREIWNLVNDGGGWDHPVHVHFEEGIILQRNGSAKNVPAWEKGRKDIYRLRPDGSVQISIQFRDWAGMFMEHCHNITHEDNAMLLRWEIDDGKAFLRPLPTPIPRPTGVVFQKTIDAA